ncbi:phage tail tape measure protein [Deinococcus sp. HMF7604]|uniref:phage tail tape measure protein n=1 Tax=Deinococcus betulae TaxID=2873312 RepID=UPI001CC93A5F|nr:phage tail tape measure protein [Deinococcus betulae]MBZ9750753.1 phage tail tape measure protein [Deinococcus betulae]
MTQTSLGDLVLTPVLDLGDVHTQLAKYRQFVERETGVKIIVDARESLNSLDRVKRDLAQVGDLNRQQTAQQTQNARLLGAQYQASMRALQEQNATVIAAHRAQTAAGRAEAAAAAERTARIREQQAQLRLTAQLATQAARDEKQRSMASVNALDQQTRAYRNLWQARQLSDDEIIEAQRRIHSQALIQAQAVDKTSDAYRRLTQVAAAAQRTMDQASGQNTPGSFSAGVHQGVLSALGNLGPFGQLAEQLGMIYQQYRAAQTEMRDAGADVGRAASDGLSEGLRIRQDEVKKEGRETGEALERGVKEALDIHSPSRVLRRVGSWAADGFVDGVRSKGDEALYAGRLLGQQAQRGLQSVNLSADFGIGPGTGLGLFSSTGGGFGGQVSGMAGAAADTKEAVDALNSLPEAAAAAELGAAGMEIAAEGMGGAVEQAAEHVQSLRDAHREADPAARATAVAEARNAIAFAATTAAVGALAFAIVTGTQRAAEFEAQMAEISLLTDKLPSELGRMGNALLKMTVDTSRSFRELKEGLDEVQGASVRGTESEEAALSFLRTAADLSKVARAEVKVGADVLTSLLNAYGMSASDAARVSDMLWASIKAGKITLAEAAQSIGSVAGQAKELNVPMEELLAATALLTSRGLPTGTALDYLRGVLTAIQKPTKEAKDKAKELGIEFSATALKTMGLVQFMDQMGRGVGENSEALSTLIGDVGGLNAAIGLLKGGLGDTGGILDKVRNSTGELSRDVQKLKGTATENVKQFHAAWERVQILFNGTLLKSFTKFLQEGVTPLLEKLGDLQTKLNEASTPKEIKATLKIDWAKDDATTMAYKLIFGAGQAIKEASTVATAAAALPVQGVFATLGQLQQRQAAIDLREQLVASGLMEGGAKNYLNQIEAILANYAKYLKLYTDAVEKGAQALGKPAGNMANTPLRGEGPLLPGQTRVGDDVSGLATVGLMGLAGRGRGTPYNGTYFGNQRHNGEDIFAPVGTEMVAPWAGYVTKRWSETTGHIIEMIDAQGQKLLLGHLDKYAPGLEAAIEKAGGKLLVKQGSLLGYVGQTGSLAHKDLGPSNAHVHIMGYSARGVEQDPFKMTFKPVTAAGGVIIPKPSTSLPKAEEKDLKDYSLTLADWNKNQARALELAREAAKAESDLTGRRGLQVDAAMRQWAGEDKARQASYQLALQLTARQRQAQQQAEADQKRASEQAKRDRDATDREAQQKQKEAEQRAAKIREALAQGRVEAASLELGRLEEDRTRDLREAGENAQKVAQVELRYAQLTYDARRAIAEKERQERDTGIRNDKNLNAAARELKLDNSGKTYDNAIRAAENALKTAQNKIAADITQQSIEAGGAMGAAITEGLEEGLALDEAMRQALEEGIAAGNEALDSLDLTQLGGRELAQVAQTLIPAEKTFLTLYDRLMGLKHEMEDPRAIAGFMQVIQDFGVAGRLTAEQVQTLLDVINDLAQAPEAAWLLDFDEQQERDTRKYGNTDAVMDYGTRMSYGVGAEGLAAALKGYGVRSIEELLTINPAAAASIQRVYADVFTQMQADLERAAQESLNILAYYREEAERIADQTARDADVGTRAIEDRDLDTVNRYSQLGPGMMLNFLGGAGNEWFGDKFSGLGEAGRTAFLEKLNAITPEDFSAVPVALLKSMQTKIGDGAEWQTLKKTLSDALSVRLDRESTDAGWKDLGVIGEEIGKLDTRSSTYATTLKDKFVPALMALRDRVTDPTLKEAIGNVLDGIDTQVANVQTLKNAQDELAEAMGQTKKPYASQIESLEQLKKTMPEAAAEIDRLIAKWRELSKEVETSAGLDKAAGQIGQIGGAFSKLFAGTDAGTFLDGMFNNATLGVKAFTQFMTGDFVGMAATTVEWVSNIIQTVENLNSGLKAWKQNMAEVGKESARGAGMSGGIFGNPYAEELRRNAVNAEKLSNSNGIQRFLWGAFGGTPQVLSAEATKMKVQAAEIFADLGQSIGSALTDSLMDAFLKADFSGVQEAMDKTLNTFIVKTAMEAVIKKSRLKDLIEDFADEAARGGDTSDEAAAIRGEFAAVTQTFASMAPGMPGYGSNLGNLDTRGVDTTGLSTLPEPIQFALATPLLEGVRGIKDAAGVLLEGATIIRDAAKAGFRVTVQQEQGAGGYRSTTGTLV